jgi:hypothetical protein
MYADLLTDFRIVANMLPNIVWPTNSVNFSWTSGRSGGATAGCERLLASGKLLDDAFGLMGVIGLLLKDDFTEQITLTLERLDNLDQIFSWNVERIECIMQALQFCIRWLIGDIIDRNESC